MSIQTPRSSLDTGTCIYCGAITAAGTRVCARHEAALHDEPPQTGGGPRDA